MIMNNGASKHVVSEVNLFTSLEQVASSEIELTTGMVVTSSGKRSTVAATGSDSFLLRIIYYFPCLPVTQMSCILGWKRTGL